LTRVRASLVDERTLARLARELRIADEMRLGEGMRRSSVDGVIADALEAVFGAVFVDAGFDAARMAVEHVYATEFAHIDPGALAKDPKTRLQEWLQARKLAVPDYTVTATSGEAHAQTMVVECRIPALGIVTTGTGPRRQSAEQVAAAEALERIAAQSGEARNG
jgi:ribonuclease-3